MSIIPVAIDIEHSDGSSTVAHQFIPKTESNSVCVIFPAMGVKASYYELLAQELTSKNSIAITVDLRGNGFSSIRPGRKVDFSYKDQLDHEFSGVLKYADSTYPDKRIFLFGHSLGGQLSCLMAGRNSHRIDGLILSATCSVHYKGWSGFSAYRILIATQFASMVARSIGYFPGKKVGFGGTEARGLIGDWSRQSCTGNYVLKDDPFDYEQALKTVTLPVLAISFEGDTFAPFRAVEHLLYKMKIAKKEHLYLQSSDPRNDGFTHFNWAKKPKNIVSIVSEWMERVR